MALKAKQTTWRLYAILLFLLVALAGLLWRLLDLSVLDQHFLLRQSKARILRKVSIPAYRGMIVDRFGLPLAISTPVSSVWINPKVFKADKQQIAALSDLLNETPQFIQSRAQENLDREFVYLKRANPPAINGKIKKLAIPGVHFQSEYKRFYPEGEVSVHVVGLTNIDDQGQEGLELSYNKWLGGQPGIKEVLKDRLGRVIEEVAMLRKPQQGHQLALSIDHRIQFLAYRVLKETIQQYHAASGSIVVLDVPTDEILAMVNQPSYNPNQRPQDHDGRYRNRAVTDMFEPGSVMKPFNIAFALESGKYTEDSTINTSPGWMMVGGYKIRDDGGINNGVLTLTQVLQKSSNIGAAKILLSLEPQEYWSLLRRFGFGERTASGFPGEANGYLEQHSTWRPSIVATLSYGYGIAVTPLQLAHAYVVLADGGVKRTATFIKLKNIPQGEQVLPEKVAKTVVQMLESVVYKGTGTRAQVPGYLVAGKTGTAYIASQNGYDRHRYVSSFVGMAPASRPRLVIAVVIRDPKKQHLGGLVAAPAFSKVMGGALRMLDVTPDNIQFNTSMTQQGVAPLLETHHG